MSKVKSNPHAWNDTIVALANLPTNPNAQKILDAAYALPLRNGQPNLAAAFRVLVERVGTKTTDGYIVINGAEVLALASELERCLE